MLNDLEKKLGMWNITRDDFNVSVFSTSSPLRARKDLGPDLSAGQGAALATGELIASATGAGGLKQPHIVEVLIDGDTDKQPFKFPTKSILLPRRSLQGNPKVVLRYWWFSPFERGECPEKWHLLPDVITEATQDGNTVTLQLPLNPAGSDSGHPDPDFTYLVRAYIHLPARDEDAIPKALISWSVKKDKIAMHLINQVLSAPGTDESRMTLPSFPTPNLDRVYTRLNLAAWKGASDDDLLGWLTIAYRKK